MQEGVYFMKTSARVLSFTVLTVVAGYHSIATAGNTTTQTINMTVSAINEIAVSSGTVNLNVNSATAGSAPNTATNNSTTWAVTSNEPADGVTVKKLTATLSSNMPAGTTLSGTYDAPDTAWATALSSGTQALSTVAFDAVTDMGGNGGNQAGMTITYDFNAAVTVAPTSFSRVVTLTLINQ